MVAEKKNFFCPLQVDDFHKTQLMFPYMPFTIASLKACSADNFNAPFLGVWRGLSHLTKLSSLRRNRRSRMRQTPSEHLLAYVILSTNKRKVALGEHLPRAVHASV